MELCHRLIYFFFLFFFSFLFLYILIIWTLQNKSYFLSWHILKFHFNKSMFGNHFFWWKRISFSIHKINFGLETTCGWILTQIFYFFFLPKKMHSQAPPPLAPRDSIVPWEVHFPPKIRWKSLLNQTWKFGFLWNNPSSNQSWNDRILRRRVNNEIHVWWSDFSVQGKLPNVPSLRVDPTERWSAWLRMCD